MCYYSCFFFFLSNFLSLCGFVPRKSEEVAGPPSARITGRRESSNVNYWNWAHVLWKVSKSASHVAISRAPKLKIVVKKKKTCVGKKCNLNLKHRKYLSFEDRVITKMMNYMLNVSEFSKVRRWNAFGEGTGWETSIKVIPKLFMLKIKNVRQNNMCYNMSSLIYVLKR